MPSTSVICSASAASRASIEPKCCASAWALTYPIPGSPERVEDLPRGVLFGALDLPKQVLCRDLSEPLQLLDVFGGEVVDRCRGP